MEDCYHLVRLLCQDPSFSSSSIETALQSYENLRIPIVTQTVAMAKKEGNMRVTKGREACLARDEVIRGGGGANPERVRLQMQVVMGPFSGESEI